ncbi:SDR family NAD(P)-dependent oxidoreductase [Legionella hackeliae]|uniref:YueD sepiapterin reductase n=1 Tax=Legionella hackeliae TaxID=449 RepID=A0A0A8UW87_LEGHA|nr:SDR family NAD(P)-dependent oxidoreductase [Legionella hackeliae]KTD15270.1 sepiapterin reductase [Legionella hackeliae]CEK11362.1 YueD sepiapterin reductase [Legionella hackeliae]STX48135.1 yueD sepiapterin reductase [Legionella hackeliae]
MFVVTGGGSGIGRALARTLAIKGKKVLIIGRREKALAETASFSPLISSLCADVATRKGRDDIATALQTNISIEGLIHNAATIEPIAPIANIDESTWQQAIATNLNAPLFLTQLLLPKLKHGRVLHIGSAVAYFPVMGWAAYCVTKAGLSMLTRCWQLESRQVAFASVMPGIIDTDMQALIRHARFMDEEKRNFFQKLKDEKRLLTTDTVALFLSWLLNLSKEEFVSREWDIYDKNHHPSWLVAPHKVPEWEE